MSNFLILTPDGVGSTYLQRALTVYLNASEHTYYNTHELLNGLALDSDFNLYKKWLGYRQSLQEISDMLDANQASLVSRLAQYHVERRLNGEMPEPPKGVPTRLIPAELLQRNQEEVGAHHPRSALDPRQRRQRGNCSHPQPRETQRAVDQPHRPVSRRSRGPQCL